MMGSPVVKSVVPFVDEAEAAAALRPMEDFYMLPIPMATYKLLAQAAARKNMTFAQLLGKAIDAALRE